MHTVSGYYKQRWHRPEPKHHRNVMWFNKGLALLLVLVLLSCSLLMAIITLQHTNRSPGDRLSHLIAPDHSHQGIQDAIHEDKTKQPSHCGTSVEEARANGCRFDPMSFSWLPAACYDAELIDTFLAIKPWSWYEDPAGSPMSFNDVQKGENHHLWVNREFHLFHCTYQWRKMHRAILQQAPLDSYIGNYSHTEHCEHVLTREVSDLGMEIVDVEIQRKFVSCGVQVKGELYQPVHLGEHHHGGH